MACEVSNVASEVGQLQVSGSLQEKEFHSEEELSFLGLNILDLPPEILLRIFIHIDIRTIFKTVILTCKRFHEILSEEDIWKTFFYLKWQNTKLARDHEYVNNWKDVYFSFDDINNFWMQPVKWSLDHKQVYGHSAPIDAVHIMPGSKFALSGSRDRTVAVWDIENFAHGEDKVKEIKEVISLAGHKVCNFLFVKCRLEQSRIE